MKARRWGCWSPGAVALLTALLAWSATAEDSGKEHMFVGSRKCAVCHEKKLMGNQFAVWKAGPHAKAFLVLGSDRAAELAKAAGVEGNPQKAEQCLRCHVTGYGIRPERLPRGKPILDEGVGCESCHGAAKHYRNQKVMSDLEIAQSKGLAIPTENRCLDCHNEENPGWDPQRYTLADGRKVGFDFAQAAALIAHPIPPAVKGHYLELKKE